MRSLVIHNFTIRLYDSKLRTKIKEQNEQKRQRKVEVEEKNEHSKYLRLKTHDKIDKSKRLQIFFKIHKFLQIKSWSENFVIFRPIIDSETVGQTCFKIRFSATQHQQDVLCAERTHRSSWWKGHAEQHEVWE